MRCQCLYLDEPYAKAFVSIHRRFGHSTRLSRAHRGRPTLDKPNGRRQGRFALQPALGLVAACSLGQDSSGVDRQFPSTFRVGGKARWNAFGVSF